MKVVFFGTPAFAAQVLQYLLEHQVDIVAVVSKPDRPKGRSKTPVPTPVKLIALNHQPSLPVYQPEKVSDPEFADVLKAYKADLFVVVAYGEIMKQHLLDMPPLGCINLHASLLPKYRGAAPIQWSVINGEKESGVTIMHMVKKMDAGDMIQMAHVSITEEMTFGDLDHALCEIGKETLFSVINDIQQGKASRTPQNPELVTFAPKIELEDCEIHWDQSAWAIHNLIRGTNPYPGAWCYVSIRGEKKRLKINRSRIFSSQPLNSQLPGALLSQDKDRLIVATKDQPLELLEIQLEGKKVMQSSELLRGLSLNQLSFLN